MWLCAVADAVITADAAAAAVVCVCVNNDDPEMINWLPSAREAKLFSLSAMSSPTNNCLFLSLF